MKSKAAAVLLAFCCVSGCVRSTGDYTGRNAWTQPKVIRIGTAAHPNTFNPLFATEAVENFLFGLSFDPLLGYDEHGELIPLLARVVPSMENGGVSKDGLTITYHLRKGVRWQDGPPLTSRDVAYTYGAIMDPRNDVPDRSGYDIVRSVDTPDAYTVVFHLRHPSSPILTKLFAEGPVGYVLPEHLLAKFTTLNHVDFNEHPVGTGPFRLVAWRRGDSIEYVANPDYYRGRPKLSRIIVRLIPDQDTAVTQLQTHEIDFLFQASSATYPRLQSLRGSGVNTVLVRDNAWIALAINTSKVPLNDVRVRQALAYAIDKPALIHRVMHDTAKVATEDIPSFLWAYDPAVPTYAYNIERARSLLKSAGWSLANGSLEKDGQELRLLLVYLAPSPTQQEMSVLIQSELAKLGIHVELKGYSSEMLYSSFADGGIIDTGKFDLAIDSWDLKPEPDNSWAVLCTAVAPAGHNDARYCNTEMDEAEHVATSTFDRTKRKQAYARIETLLAHDVPYIFIGWPQIVDGISAGTHGVPAFGNPSQNANEWSN